MPNDTPEKISLARAATMRAYGYEYKCNRENPALCVVAVSGSERWSDPRQCSKPRGHGEGGLFCTVHARKPRRVPDVGGWGRHLIERLERERKPLVVAAARLAEVDAHLAIIRAALPVAPSIVEHHDGMGDD